MAETEEDHVRVDENSWLNKVEQNFVQNLYFPTQVFAYSLEAPIAGPLNTSLVTAIRAGQDREQKGIERSNFRALGGWHSSNDLHKQSDFIQLVRLINTCCGVLSHKNSYHEDFNLVIGSMWSIVNRPGSWNRAHIHPGSNWSGVYYVQAPEGSGDIEFTDPRTANVFHDLRYSPNRQRPKSCWSKVTFKPEAGKLLIFPSWLYHSVAPNLSTAEGDASERIIISFNLLQTRDFTLNEKIDVRA
jgi:uncharacterized protein (TIGR02466 family)